jgi:hypothetical protein
MHNLYQQLRGHKVEEKLHLGVSKKKKRLNTAGLFCRVRDCVVVRWGPGVGVTCALCIKTFNRIGESAKSARAIIRAEPCRSQPN